jgi:methionine-R-sulfoxide reductase
MDQIIKTHKPPMRNFRRDEEAVRELSPEQFRVTQRSGTECPGTGEHLHNEEPGIYVDVVSGEPLFASSDKFDSGSGWPSFTRPIDPANVNEVRDTTHAMTVTEVRSTHGDSHLRQLRGSSIHPSRGDGGGGLCGLHEPGAGRPMTHERGELK